MTEEGDEHRESVRQVREEHQRDARSASCCSDERECDCQEAARALQQQRLLGRLQDDHRVLREGHCGFTPEKSAEQHRAVAKELWYIREQYLLLLTDIQAGPQAVDIVRRRDELLEELKHIYRLTPDTSSDAYRAAQRAMQIDEDMTFSNEEINRFLPEALRVP